MKSDGLHSLQPCTHQLSFASRRCYEEPLFTKVKDIYKVLWYISLIVMPQRMSIRKTGLFRTLFFGLRANLKGLV